VDDRITLVENGVKVAENAVMTNLCAPGEPVYAQGRIELAGQGALVAFRNLWINELPSTPVFSLPADEAAAGYEVLFDGRSLYKWTGNTTNYVPLDGTIDVTATYGGSGNLYTVGEYGDFILRFEFRFLTEGVNNGIGIRWVSMPRSTGWRSRFSTTMRRSTRTSAITSSTVLFTASSRPTA